MPHARCPMPMSTSYKSSKGYTLITVARKKDNWNDIWDLGSEGVPDKKIRAAFVKKQLEFFNCNLFQDFSLRLPKLDFEFCRSPNTL